MTLIGQTFDRTCFESQRPYASNYQFPTNQPNPNAKTIKKVNQPKEVHDNVSHDLTNKIPPFESTSSAAGGRDENEMDVDDASQGEIHEQEEPGHISHPNSPNSTQKAHKK